MERSVDEDFSAVLAPILRDLAAGHVAATPRRGRYAGQVEVAQGPPVLLIHAPDDSDCSSCAISLLSDTPIAEQLARVADQVQEWAIEVLWTAGEPAVWPHCPDHPDSHPLHARVQQWTDGARHEDAAVWACPKSGRVVCAIGELAAASKAAA